ncbi:unnamed protein product [Notodromas monacha]|uniref:HMG box domain-containing protein n=1 Tax=Notodromas monacha TaxID=399045 RepID=A0A7R9GBV5_9CRUS|nr:unnamed protein product [Notodromas monacha]CAG0915367.1 unnamed protein product [Notodromas monacha]
MPRAAKDDKPKGRMTAYAFFLQACRNEQKKKNPEATVVFTEFTKKCSEQWKKMSEKEKARFQKLAAADKDRYNSEMKNAPKGTAKRGKKAKKDPNAPKRSMSAFFWFCDEERPKVRKENPGWPVGEVAKELGRRWATVTASDKVRFQKMADKDKDRYGKEMASFKKGGKPAKAPAHIDEDDEEEEEEDEGEEDDDDLDDD